MRNRARLISGHKSPDSGFALPVAVGMGLIMLLIGVTIIVRAQTDKNDAVIRKDTSDSLTAAETGVVRVREFLNRYRMLALYPACGGNWDATTGDCDDTTTTNWDNADLITNLGESCSTPSVSSDATEVENLTTGNWLPISADTDQGEYRLISYNYNHPAGVQKPDGAGTLVVQGRIQKNGSTVSESQLLVGFPVTERQTQAPALWVTESITGNPVINADVFAPCGATVSASPATGYNTIFTDLTMPMPSEAPIMPTTVPGPIDLGATASDLTLPRVDPATGLVLATDTPSADGFYEYKVGQVNGTLIIKDPTPLDKLPLKLRLWVDNGSGGGALTLGTNQKLWIQDNSEVQIMVTGGITLTSNAAIQVSGVNNISGVDNNSTVELWTRGNIAIGSGAVQNFCNTELNCGPFDFKIYGTGASGSTLTYNEEASICDVLFHAPNYAVTFTAGTPPTDACGSSTSNTGIYWVRSWTGGSGSDTVIHSPRAAWHEMPTKPIPIIGPVGIFKPQDVP